MRLCFMLLWSLLLLVNLGCGNAGQAQLGEPPEIGEAREEHALGGHFPQMLTDASGAEIVLESPPQRIVSILPSQTENAFALGLGERIVGVSDWDNYPEEVEKIAKVGGLEPSVERILSLDPDLILAGASANAKAIEPLRDLGLPVLVLPEAQSFSGAYDALRLLGQATGTLPEAEAVIAAMEREKRSITERLSTIPEEQKPRVWVEVSPDLVTAGEGTFINDIIQLAGGINVAADEKGWPKVSEEQVIAWAPEVILTTYGHYVAHPLQQVYARAAWSALPAVKAKRVYDVNNDILTRPGPRLVDGLAEVARYLHPDRF